MNKSSKNRTKSCRCRRAPPSTHPFAAAARRSPRLYQDTNNRSGIRTEITDMGTGQKYQVREEGRTSDVSMCIKQ